MAAIDWLDCFRFFTNHINAAQKQILCVNLNQTPMAIPRADLPLMYFAFNERNTDGSGGPSTYVANHMEDKIVVPHRCLIMAVGQGMGSMDRENVLMQAYNTYLLAVEKYPDLGDRLSKAMVKQSWTAGNFRHGIQTYRGFEVLWEWTRNL